jgi:hypothetical protein
LYWRKVVSAKDPKPPLSERLALRPREAAAAIGLSERAFRLHLPRVPHLRLGGVVVIPVEGFRRWLEEQARAQVKRAEQTATEILRDMRDAK